MHTFLSSYIRTNKQDTNRPWRERRDSPSAFSLRVNTYVTGCPLYSGHPQHHPPFFKGDEQVSQLYFSQKYIFQAQPHAGQGGSNEPSQDFTEFLNVKGWILRVIKFPHLRVPWVEDRPVLIRSPWEEREPGDIYKGPLHGLLIDYLLFLESRLSLSSLLLERFSPFHCCHGSQTFRGGIQEGFF